MPAEAAPASLLSRSWGGGVKTLALIAAVTAPIVYWMRPRVVHPVELGTLSSEGVSDPCNQKLRYLFVYLAPWCPVCKRARSVVSEIRYRFSGSTKVGVKLVVGMDKRPKLEAYAKELGEPVFLDVDGALRREVDIPGVPHWFVTDARGKILDRLSGFIEDVDENIKALHLDPERLASIR